MHTITISQKLSRAFAYSVISPFTMFVLPFLLYTYMTNQTVSSFFNASSWADASQWVAPSFSSLTLPFSSPTTSLPVTSAPDMTPYAVYYFLTGAMFFLGSAYMILSSHRDPQFTALDGIATMSDFTKTNVMNYISDYKPNREILALVTSNGMDAEEFLNILAGNSKRPHRVPSTTST